MKKYSSSIKKMTIGLDVGDQHSYYVVLDGEGEAIEDGRIRTRQEALGKKFSGLPRICSLSCPISCTTGTRLSPSGGAAISVTTSNGQPWARSHPGQGDPSWKTSRSTDKIDQLACSLKSPSPL